MDGEADWGLMEAVRVITAEGGIVSSVRLAITMDFAGRSTRGVRSYRDDEELLTAGAFWGSSARAYVYQPIIISSQV